MCLVWANLKTISLDLHFLLLCLIQLEAFDKFPFGLLIWFSLMAIISDVGDIETDVEGESLSLGVLLLEVTVLFDVFWRSCRFLQCPQQVHWVFQRRNLTVNATTTLLPPLSPKCSFDNASMWIISPEIILKRRYINTKIKIWSDINLILTHISQECLCHSTFKVHLLFCFFLYSHHLFWFQVDIPSTKIPLIVPSVHVLGNMKSLTILGFFSSTNKIRRWDISDKIDIPPFQSLTDTKELSFFTITKAVKFW